MLKRKRLVKFSMATLMCGLLVLSAPTLASAAEGTPFNELQNQVDEANVAILELILSGEATMMELQDAFDTLTAALAAATQAMEIPVDCAMGDTVANALDLAEGTTGRVTITIIGTCIENVFLFRDDVTINGASPGDGLQATSSGSIPLHINSSKRIFLNDLTLTGGSRGLQVTNGSSFRAINLEVTGAASFAVVFVTSNSSGVLINSTIENGASNGLLVNLNGIVRMIGGLVDNNGAFGVNVESGGSVDLVNGAIVQNNTRGGAFAHDGGSIKIDGATVKDNLGTGVFAFNGGSVNVRGSTTLIQNNLQGGVVANAASAVVGAGARVANNPQSGVSGFNGGIVTIQDGAIVENNGGDGLTLLVGSSAVIRSGSIIRGNVGNGVFIRDTGVASLSDVKVINNTGNGVLCDPLPAVAQISLHGTNDISGNAAPQIDCPIVP